MIDVLKERGAGAQACWEAPPYGMETLPGLQFPDVGYQAAIIQR